MLGAGEALFRGALALRRAAYRAGLAKARAVPRPVISVGNLTAGGNGKTPFTMLLADRLERRGLHAAVVMRGYAAARARADASLIVAVRGEVRAAVEEAGDEATLIARRTKASVVVDRDRARGARTAIDVLGADVVVLDDGFQHWRLARDLDLVVLDARAPFDNGHLIPRGRLRELPPALERAALIAVHRGDADDPWPLPPGVRIDLEVGVRPERLTLGGQEQSLQRLAGARVALLAAIARPERFRRTVERLGAEVVDATFLEDHQRVSEEMIATVQARARERGAALVLTTEKDQARFPDAARGAGLWTLGIELVILRGDDRLESELTRAIERRAAPSPT